MGTMKEHSFYNSLQLSTSRTLTYYPHTVLYLTKDHVRGNLNGLIDHRFGSLSWYDTTPTQLTHSTQQHTANNYGCSCTSI